MGNTIIHASQKLIRGLSSKFVGDPYIAEAAVLVPSQFRNNPGTPNWFFGPNGIDYKFIFDGMMSATKAYQQCPPLSAIVNRKAQAYINGRTVILNSQEKEVTTGEQVKKIKRIMARPNPLQTWKQFEAQQYLYMQIYGFCLTLPVWPAGYETAPFIDCSSLWNVPAYMLTYEERKDRTWFSALKPSDIISNLRIRYKDLDVPLDVDRIMIFKDFVIGSESMFFPSSRIRALQLPINNIIAAYESRNELINYAGSQGILTPETDASGAIPMKEGEKDQLQADFKRQYGIKKGQSRYIISPAALKWQPMGKATKDLMLFEEIQDDIMRLCDGYGYPSPLLNSDKGPSVSNTKEFKAQVYQDAIIPESMDIYEQWDGFFQLSQYNLSMKKNYLHLPVLQENQVDEGQAQLYQNQSCQLQYMNNVITLNQWRQAQGIDTVPGDDIYYVDVQARNREKYPPPEPQNTNPQNDNENDNEDQAE